MNPRTVTLLKHGRPVVYLRCKRCEQLFRSLSEIGMCSACEVETMKGAPPVGRPS